MKPFQVIKLPDEECLKHVQEQIDNIQNSTYHNNQQKRLLVNAIKKATLELNNTAYYLRSEIYPVLQIHLPQITESGEKMTAMALNSIEKLEEHYLEQCQQFNSFLRYNSIKLVHEVISTYYGFAVGFTKMHPVVGNHKDGQHYVFKYFDGENAVLSTYGKPFDSTFDSYYIPVTREDYSNNYQIVF